MTALLDRAGRHLDQRLAKVSVVECPGALGANSLAFDPGSHVINDNMMTPAANLPDRQRPPDLHFTMTGERFEFQTSAKSGDGVFRFRWTLARGKNGPRPSTSTTPSVRRSRSCRGRCGFWLDGVPRDLGPGQAVTVEAGARHRFLNPGTEPVVVDVSLDGPLQEDALVPLALRLGGRTNMGFRDFCVMVVHAVDVRASTPPSKAAAAIVNGLARLFRLFGARPLPRAAAW